MSIPGVGGMSDRRGDRAIAGVGEGHRYRRPRQLRLSRRRNGPASDALKAHFIAIDSLDNELEVEGQKYRLKVTPKPGVDIDMEAFNELVDPEIREQVVIEKVTHSMRDHSDQAEEGAC